MNRSALNHGPFPMLLAALAGGVGLMDQSAQGQTLSWVNAAGGSAGTAGNWNPAQVPGAASILNFGLAGAYSVSFPAAVPASAQQNFNAGTISLSMLVPHTASTQFVVGLTAGSTPNVTFTGGTLTAPVVSVAANPTSTAALTITGPTADVFSTGAGGTRIGNTGNGTLTIANGGSLRSTNFVNIGSATGSQGSVTVTGANGANASELVTLNAANGNLNIAGGGPGTLAVSGGGVVDIAGSVFIAPTLGLVGSAVVGVGRFEVAGDFHLGHNTNASGAGTGTYTANSGSTTLVNGELFLGDSAGGTGTLTTTTGANVQTRSLTVDGSNGVLNLLGGLVLVNGGVFTAPNNQLILNGGVGGSPIFSLAQNAQSTLSAPVGSRALTVGTDRNAVFNLQNSAALTVTSGNIVLGDGSGSAGTLQMQVNTALSQAGTGTMTVGNLGAGTLLMIGASELSSGPIEVGAGRSGTGSVLVDTSSSISIHGTLALGGTIAASGGAGSMTIGNRASVTVNGGAVNFPVKVWDAGGSLTIGAGGTLTSTGAVLVLGEFTLGGGTVNANNVVLQGATTYPVTGTFSSSFQPGPSAIVNLTGPLGVRFLLNDGTINLGDHTLTIPPPGNAANIGNATLGALGRVVSPVPLTVGSGKVLSGDGVIDAAISNSGTITGAGDGLTINGIVTGLGEGIGGTKIEFGPAGGFTGAGTFSNVTSVLAQAGSVILATGDLTMGSSSANNAFISRGRIDVAGNSDVVLRSGTRAQTHDIAFLDGDPLDLPKVRSSSGIVVDGLVTGTGLLGGGLNVLCSLSSSTLSPGSASESGALSFSCDTFMGSTTRTEIDIFDATTHDQIRTLGNVVILPSIHTVPSDITLAGTLVLRVAPGHAPTNGETHQIVDVVQGVLGPDGFVNGGFANIEAPRHWIINVVRASDLIHPNGVFAVYCTADFNEDGFVDFFDYDSFVECFETGVCPPETSADFNGDGFTDFFDYDDFVLSFEQGC